MGLSNRSWFRIANDTLHDLTAGFFPGAVLSLWYVRSGAQRTLDPAAFDAVMRNWSWILLIMFLALLVLGLTGSVRLSYRTLGVSADALPAKGRAALIKHSVFVLVFVASAVEAFVLLQP